MKSYQPSERQTQTKGETEMRTARKTFAQRIGVDTREPKVKTRKYMNDDVEIGFERGEAWLQAEITDPPLFGVQAVVFDKHCDVPLNSKQCRDLAEWLIKAADAIKVGET